MNLLLSPLFCSFFLLTGWSATALANAIGADDTVSATQAVGEALPAERIAAPDPASNPICRPRREETRNFISSGAPSAIAAGSAASFPEPLALTSIQSLMASLGAAKLSHFGRLSARRE